jgi:hypothetical protein
MRFSAGFPSACRDDIAKLQKGHGKLPHAPRPGPLPVTLRRLRIHMGSPSSRKPARQKRHARREQRHRHEGHDVVRTNAIQHAGGEFAAANDAGSSPRVDLTVEQLRFRFYGDAALLTEIEKYGDPATTAGFETTSLWVRRALGRWFTCTTQGWATSPRTVCAQNQSGKIRSIRPGVQ